MAFRSFAAALFVALLFGSTLLSSSARACDDRYPGTCATSSANPQTTDESDDLSSAYAPPVTRGDLIAGAVRANQKRAKQPRAAAEAHERSFRHGRVPWWIDTSASGSAPLSATAWEVAQAWLLVSAAKAAGTVHELSAEESTQIDQVIAGMPVEGDVPTAANTDAPTEYDLTWLRGLATVCGAALVAGSAARFFLV